MKFAAWPREMQLEALFFEHVAADEPEIADVFLHEVGNVVVAHEQHVERHVLAEAHELVAAARELEAAALEQLERRIGEATGLLDGELEALLCRWVRCHGVPMECGEWAIGREPEREAQAWRCWRLTASE